MSEPSPYAFVVSWLKSVVNAPWVYPPDYYADRDRRIKEAAERQGRDRQRENDRCDICSGRSRYLCPICRVPIEMHTHENDYICETHSFVYPIRESDGKRINGDGCG